MTMATTVASNHQEFTSLGLSGRAHVVVILVTVASSLLLLRMLRRRQLRAKYALLWILVGVGVLALAAYPASVDRVSRWLVIYYAPSTVFVAAIGFLLLVCVYFSYELSRLEERTRVLAEELAILREGGDGERVGAVPTPSPGA